MVPGRDRTRDPRICIQTRICNQTRYRLRYAARLKNTVRELKINCAETLVDWYNLCREVCSEVIGSQKVKVGGPGKVVEIEESKLGKRKYHKGRRKDGVWVFGGIERDSNNCFLTTVEDRSANTLRGNSNNQRERFTWYEGCSNMNASSFITFFTYMLRQNVILFWKELFVAFKMAPNIKKYYM